MKTIRYNGTRYRVYSQWADVPIFKLHLLNKGAELVENNEIDQALFNASILSDFPMAILKEMKLKDLQRIFRRLKFAEAEPPNKHVNEFKFKGKVYTIANPFSEDYIGKYIVTEQLVLKNEEIIESINKGEFKYYPYLIACIVTEKGKAYTNAEIDARAAAFNSLPVPIALGVVSFFLHKYSKLGNIIKLYSNRERILRDMSKTSETSTDGMPL